MKNKTLFWIVGEKSGENIACDIIKEIQEDQSLDMKNICMTGIASQEMRALGVAPTSRSEDIAVMGIWEVFCKIRSILKIINQTAEKILAIQPAIVVSIDSYDLCIRIAKKVRKYNKDIHFLHIVAPSVWAYNANRAKIMAQYYNTLLCILPFELQYFKQYDIKTKFIGYPAVYKGLTERSNMQNIQKDDNLIAITLGSRMSEIKRHVALIDKTVELFYNSKNNQTQFLFAKEKMKFVLLLNEDNQQKVKQLIKKYLHLNKIQIIFDKEEKTVIMQKAKLAIAKSGTNTLEFLIFGTPIITYYKVSWLTYILGRLFVKIKFTQLINIMANKEIIPEFIQHKASPINLYNKMISFFQTESIGEKQLKEVNFYLQKMLTVVKGKHGRSPATLAKNEIQGILS